MADAADARRHLAHHFDSFEQQHSAATLGMWIFLATEVMLFGGLFTAFAGYHTRFPDGFTLASRRLDVVLGAINTVVLIVSSLTAALAVHAGQVGERRRVTRYLLVTSLLGLVFLGIKGLEYWHHYQERLVPGLAFDYTGPQAESVQLFFIFYFVMTGLHAIHLTVGVALVAVIAYLAHRGRFPAIHHHPIELTGLYWHFVDVVWLFLLPLLYLIGIR